MNRDEILATLRRNAATLQARGVRHAALFGSVARGDTRPGSDIDILIEFEPHACVTVYDYVRLKNDIADLFEGPVDVIDRDALKPHLSEPSVRDAIYAF